MTPRGEKNMRLHLVKNYLTVSLLPSEMYSDKNCYLNFLLPFAISADLISNGYPDSYYIDGIFCGYSQAIQERFGMAS